MGTIDEFSTAPTSLSLSFNSRHLSNATGFFWAANDRIFLITNWHVVTGRNPHTGQHLSPTSAEPSSVTIMPLSKGSLDARLPLAIPLWDSDGQPLWLIHPRFGKAIDVVALPLEAPTYEYADPHPINLMPSAPLRVQVGADVFVIGYPIGPSIALAAPMSPGLVFFPVWKRGSIASEPNIQVGSQRHVLVDTASRPGMSGSPVVMRHWTNHVLEDGNVRISPSPGTRFLGVYSGRLGTNDALDAQLGFYWPAKLVDEIVAGQLKDKR